MKILIKGWTEIPHSYSIVNGFQLIHLYKNFSNLEIFIEEMPYYRAEWNNSKKQFFSDEYTGILKNLKKWNGEKVDLIYSITYPYDITLETGVLRDVPKCVFYTSEFKSLLPHYFRCDSNLTTNEKISDFLKEHDNFYFTGPSEWSINGLRSMDLPDERNHMITHGVDTSIFYHKSNETRKKVRQFYGINEDDFVLLNIGAMTRNKGIIHIMLSLYKLVYYHNKKNYKLLFKGMGDLYQTKTFLEHYFDEFLKSGIMTNENVSDFLKNHIIFLDKTISYENINNLMNAADLYISPYLAEGFNLTVLESVSAGCNILVPKTGSTKEFVENIKNNGGEPFVYYVDSNVIEEHGMTQNSISIDNLVTIILQNEVAMKNVWKKNDTTVKYNKMITYIKENYSWDFVSKELMKYFEKILS